MAVNKHGLVMKNLQMACSITETLEDGYYFAQISYDMSDGRVLVDKHIAGSIYGWTTYHDPNIIPVASYCFPKTMQEIADMIAKAVANH